MKNVIHFTRVSNHLLAWNCQVSRSINYVWYANLLWFLGAYTRKAKDMMKIDHTLSYPSDDVTILTFCNFYIAVFTASDKLIFVSILQFARFLFQVSQDCDTRSESKSHLAPY